MTMQELSDEMRKERARCSTHCGTWNSEDKDCEIYGEYHCPPSKCRYFLATELARRNKEKEKQKHEEKVRELCPNCNKPMWRYTYVSGSYLYCSFCHLRKDFVRR